MTKSHRLIKAGFAFIVLGAVSSMLPNSGIMLAEAAGCPPPAPSSSSTNNSAVTADVVGGTAAVGAGYYLFHSGGGGGVFAYRKHKQGSTQATDPNEANQNAQDFLHFDRTGP